MGRTMIEIDEEVRDELRSYKADRGMTYDEAITLLFTESGHDFRHLRPGEKDE